MANLARPLPDRRGATLASGLDLGCLISLCLEAASPAGVPVGNRTASAEYRATPRVRRAASDGDWAERQVGTHYERWAKSKFERTDDCMYYTAVLYALTPTYALGRFAGSR